MKREGKKKCKQFRKISQRKGKKKKSVCVFRSISHLNQEYDDEELRTALDLKVNHGLLVTEGKWGSRHHNITLYCVFFTVFRR